MTKTQNGMHSTQRFFSVICALLLALFLSLPVWGQTAQAPAPSQAPQQAPSKSTEPTETRITPQQAEELFRSVDEILQFASKDTGLPIKHPVARKLSSRDEVVSYIQRRMAEDPDTARLDRSTRTLEKLGLVPKGFELRKFLLGMMREQVAGFYDPKTKTVYMLDWVTADVQRPVLAHELTHALQDQTVDLDKWGDVNGKKLTPAEEIQRDEERLARQAVVEGQAMLVLLDYVLAPLGRTVADSPAIVDGMRSEMLTSGATPMFSSAPLYLREGLVFPYMSGLDLVRKVLVANGKQAAFAGMLKNPPLDSRQVMDPDTYLHNEHTPELKVPDLGKVLGDKWEPYDYGVLGAFDVQVINQQWAGKQLDKKLSKAWRGGYYWSFDPKDVKSKEPLRLVMAVRWADEASAREFDKVYRDAIASRYKQAKSVAAGIETEEGLVASEVRGTLWLATESFDATQSSNLRDAMAKAALQ